MFIALFYPNLPFLSSFPFFFVLIYSFCWVLSRCLHFRYYKLAGFYAFGLGVVTFRRSMKELNRAYRTRRLQHRREDGSRAFCRLLQALTHTFVNMPGTIFKSRRSRLRPTAFGQTSLSRLFDFSLQWSACYHRREWLYLVLIR